jgi:hypothetical protein
MMELQTGGERLPATYISSSQGWANSGMGKQRTIAIVGHWRDRPNPQDDARLIAAAPELLDACKAAFDYVGDAHSDEAVRLFNVLEKAIAQATSKEN